MYKDWFDTIMQEKDLLKIPLTFKGLGSVKDV